MKKKSLFKFLSLSLMAFAFAGLLTLGINFLSKDVALDKTSQEESVTYADAHSTIYRSDWDSFKYTYSSEISNVTSVVTANSAPLTTGQINISIGDNVYVDINGSVMTIYSMYGTTIHLPTDSSYFFFDSMSWLGIFSHVTTMDLQNFDTSSVTNMSTMFYECRSLTNLDLSNFDTSNVTNMAAMFQGCSALTSLDLSSFNTSNVTNMGEMFYYCVALTNLDVSSFNTSLVTGMFSMFYQCHALTSLDLSNFNTSNVSRMSHMFSSCYALTSLDVSSFDTSNVTDMSFMFTFCYGLTDLDLSSFNTSNVTDMSHMFSSCYALTSLGLSNFDTSSVTSTAYMFCNCYDLYKLDISSFNMSKVSSAENMFSGCNNLRKIYLPRSVNYYYNIYLTHYYRTESGNYSGWYLNDFQSTLSTSGNKVAIITNEVPSQDAVIYKSSWNNFKNDCSYQIGKETTRIETKKNYNPYAYDYELGENTYAYFNGNTLEIYTTLNKNIELPSDCSEMFNVFCSATEMNLAVFNTSNVTDMSYMFQGCYALTSLDLSGFDTTNVTNMSSMFEDCHALTSLDLSGFDTTNVTNMGGMFRGCEQLYKLDISSFNMSNVSNAENMFSGCSYLRKIYLPGSVSYYYNIYLTHYYRTENGNYTGYYLNNFQFTLSTSGNKVAIITNEVPSQEAVIYKNNWDNFKNDCSNQIRNTTRVETKKNYNPYAYDYELGENTYAYFNGNTLEIYTTLNKDIELPSDSSYFFFDSMSLLSIFSHVTTMDLQNFDTSSVTNMSDMFRNCSALTSLDLSGFNTSNVTSMEQMFYECRALTSLDLSGFNTTNVTNMSYMFGECSALTSLDLSNFDTSNVTNMSYMFHGCYALTSLDLSNFDTSNVTDMSQMFYCPALTSIDVTGFDTSSVTGMSYMFHNCSALTNIDLSSFDTSSVTSMWGMFASCRALISLDLSSFDTSKVTNMDSMFNECRALTNLDLSSFNTSRVTNMMVMFGYNPVLTSLDLSSFDMGAVTNADSMFENCTALTQIYMPKVLPDIKNVSTIDLPGASEETTETYSLVNDGYTTQSANLMDFPVSTTGEKQQIVRGSSAAETIDIEVSGNGSVSVESFEYREGQEITTSGNQLLIDGVVVVTATPEKFDGYIVRVSWDLTNIESNIVKANFVKTPRNYTISYKLNGGTVSETNPTTYNLETNTFTLNNPTKEGYTFTGWSGTGLNGKVKTVKITKGSQGNRSYSANFTVNQYTITLKDGDNVIKTIKQNYGTSISVANPEKFGYTFAGWDTSIPKKMPAENMTINARFTLTNYTITYKLDGGQVQGGNPKSYTMESEDFTLVNPTKEGYVFSGWIENENDEPTMEYVVAQGSTGNKTLTAVWTEKLQQEEEEEKKQQDSSLIIGASIGGGIALAGLAGGIGIIFGSKRKKIV